MWIRIKRDGAELYCGPFLEWYRHNSFDTRMRDLVVRATLSEQEVHSGLEFPDHVVSILFGVLQCPGEGKPACAECYRKSPGRRGQ